MEEFGPTLHYIKGEDNVVTDALSRLPIKSKTTNKLTKNGQSTKSRSKETRAILEIRYQFQIQT